MKLLNVLIFIVCSMQAFATNDHIILRNGIDKKVKLHQISDEKVIYGDNDNQTTDFYEVPSKEVYMVFIEKQGNVYLTKEGKRVTGETETVNRDKYNMIYLVKGKEIAANEISISENSVTYAVNKNKKSFRSLMGKGQLEHATLPKSEVFMVRYKNGMTDVITPFKKEEKVEKVDTLVNKKPEYVVVFHAVEKGETLMSISEKYNVSLEKIIEWNDLPSTTKKNSPLKLDMQLMIYQQKK